MRTAFPQLAPAPWLLVAHSNTGYNPAAETCSPSFFENMTFSMSPSSGSQGLNVANPPAVLSDSYKPSILLGLVHNSFPEFQVPIFQLTGQRQPFDSSHMKTDLSYQSWNADSGTSSQTEPLQVDLSYCRSPSESLKVWDSNPSEESCPSPACSLVSLDDDFRDFQSIVRRPGVLVPTASDSRPRDRPDKLSVTPYTGMPQRTIDGPSTLTQTAQGLLDTQANKVSFLPADQHKLLIISDYHSV